MWGPVWCGRHIDFFKKCPKLGFQLTIWMALVKDIRLKTKKNVCIVKDFKKTSKINQSIKTCTDAVMKCTRGWGSKSSGFPPKTSYKLGSQASRFSCTDQKQFCQFWENNKILNFKFSFWRLFFDVQYSIRKVLPNLNKKIFILRWSP